MNPSLDPQQQRLLIPNLNSQAQWNFNLDVVPSQQSPHSLQGSSGTIKLPSIMPSTRSSTRQRADSIASGSEYHASNASMDVDDQEEIPDDEEEQVQKRTEYTVTSRGRKVPAKSYKESASEDDPVPEDDDPLNIIDHHSDDRDAHAHDDVPEDDDEDDEDGNAPRYKFRKTAKRGPKLNGFIASDEEGEPTVTNRYSTRIRSKQTTTQVTNGRSSGRLARRNGGSGSKQHPSRRQQSRKNNRRTLANARRDEQDGNYEDDGEAEASSSVGSADGSIVEAEELDIGADADAEADAEGDPDEQENEGKPYALRQRAKINYAIPPPLEEMRAPPPKPRSGGRSNGRSGRSKAPGWSATGAELSRWMGGGGDDSVGLSFSTCY